MTSFLRHEYPVMPVINESCQYMMSAAHDSASNYSSPLDQCRYYGTPSPTAWHATCRVRTMQIILSVNWRQLT